MAASVVLRYRRKLAEQYIEHLIALLDEMDGDPDLEDSDPMEMNGDEWDCSLSEDDWSPFDAGSPRFDGSGIPIAHSMIRGAPAAQRRADAYLHAAAPPLVYDFREMLK